MKEAKVKEIRQIVTVEPVVVLEETPLYEIVKIFINNPITRAAYVVNSEDCLEGIITIQDILKRVSIDFFSLSSFSLDASFSGYQIAASARDSTAKDLMNPEVYFVYDDDPIEKAFNLIFQYSAGEIPVINKDNKLIGDLNIVELLVLWNETKQNTGE